jgi:phycocyanobilin:ferredoxin oxidoreductase
MSDHFEIKALMRRTEEDLRRELELIPRAVPPDLARAEGVFRGNPIVIETRAYEGPLVRFARFATILGGGVEIGNALCLGRPDAAPPIPIFGADLVTLSPDIAMLAADISPVLPAGAERDAQLRPFAERAALRPALPPGGELPSFCAAWFSPYALFTRVSPSAAALAAAAYVDLPPLFAAIARESRPHAPAYPRADEALRAQARYLEDHRTDDKGLRMIGKVFGQAFADRYIARLLFPEEGAI